MDCAASLLLNPLHVLISPRLGGASQLFWMWMEHERFPESLMLTWTLSSCPESRHSHWKTTWITGW